MQPLQFGDVYCIKHRKLIAVAHISSRLSSVSPSSSSSDLPGRQRRSELADLLLDRTGRHLGQEGRLGHPRRQPQELPGSRVQDHSGGDGRRERGVQRRTFQRLRLTLGNIF